MVEKEDIGKTVTLLIGKPNSASNISGQIIELTDRDVILYNPTNEKPEVEHLGTYIPLDQILKTNYS